MARAGLGPGWDCAFANDLCPRKAAAYALNWDASVLRVCDVATLTPADLPGRADAAWASFPCQDLSLAGAGAGLGGVGGARTRSGAFWPFLGLVRAQTAEGRRPRALAIENVCGLLTRRGGADFAALAGALAGDGWRFGAMVADARLFLPQSRPRLFVLAFDPATTAPPVAAGPASPWHPPALAAAAAGLPDAVRARWLWLAPPAPPPRTAALADVLEAAPRDVGWHDAGQTARLVALMSAANRAKLDAARAAGGRSVGTLYRRTRIEGGLRVQRAEARFDGIAGCLRTPAGGSSRQTLLLVEDGRLRSRLLSAREAARLMGLPDAFRLPPVHTDACHLLGDGVAAPVVRWLAAHLIEPALGAAARAAA